MRKILASLVCLAALALPLRAQSLAQYQINKTTALVSAVESITVQATAASSAVQFETADVYCSVTCNITISSNGTAATATTLAVSGPVGVVSATAPVAFSASNVGSGSTWKTYTIPAGSTLALSLADFTLPAGGGGAANFTITTSSITGTVRIQIQCSAKP